MLRHELPRLTQLVGENLFSNCFTLILTIMKKFYTVRFRNHEDDVQYSAIFSKRWQAELYLEGFTSEGYIE